ncbi:NADP-dependent oxidoreductase domain-containing protein [Lophiotrema nucula]|uniref:NADP-dependent oxidoreductase domain-containing protein n=1 Tax=Lophiotrema nucula TaxID=690887 RepID=A0A6A5ZHM3_9PLEO|nr:NADP-dependent oxidoreductase domain-containing protein [Lophiotrema nucula]
MHRHASTAVTRLAGAGLTCHCSKSQHCAEALSLAVLTILLMLGRSYFLSRSIRTPFTARTIMAASKAEVELVFGGGSVGSGTVFEDRSILRDALDVLKKEGVKRLDSAHLYGESESLFGKANAGKDFIIDSKIKGGFEPGSAKKDGVLKGIELSLDRLNVEKLGIFYIHAPDYETPLEETLAAINEVYTAGKFDRFGLSNYKAEDVQKVFDLCVEKGYPTPTAYQGNYSAVARKLEDTLLPTLRKLAISFYVYSPMAGGFLSKTKADIEKGAGRFNESSPGGSMYTKMYKKPAFLDALADWESIADAAGCGKAELAYRWVAFNSQLSDEHGDGVLIGASSVEQLQDTLNNLKNGPLAPEIASRIDNMWTKLAAEAPTDNFHL